MPKLRACFYACLAAVAISHCPEILQSHLSIRQVFRLMNLCSNTVMTVAADSNRASHCSYSASVRSPKSLGSTDRMRIHPRLNRHKTYRVFNFRPYYNITANKTQVFFCYKTVVSCFSAAAAENISSIWVRQFESANCFA